MSNTTITTLRETDPTPIGLVWENPPARGGKPGKYAGLAAALRENPGQWAMVRQCTDYRQGSGFAQHIRTGRYVDFRDGIYETEVHSVDGAARVYVRYNASAVKPQAVPNAVA